MSDQIIPCRKAFTNTILEEAKVNEKIFVVTSDARGSVTLDKYADEMPEQFVEVGIAEQNAVGVGAGLALAGNNVFVCGPACFYSARALEQVKVDVAYTNTNVKIIGVSGGVSYGALGATHHSLHDLAVMRTFPGMEVYLPADRFQTEKLIRHLVRSEKPAYIRMGRNAVPDVYTENDDFEFGKAKVLAEGKDITLIVTGETVYHAVKAAEKLADDGIEATVVDLVSVKPFDKETVLGAIKNTKCVLTVEEHSIYGGVGAMVAELIAQEYPIKMKILGIPDENVINAKPLEILEYYGLTAENIYAEAKKLVSN
ncbi:transketolase C-terminal domain-containing protein [uncultured Draconibacterium sp.]|uniref:transketolase family protein n=1 Tax=uncultured Draconibacterium sp. TaxID=1573823 RepID=UPI0029C95066|nr:transketolase C-terminal domain-containing protein [uncultured Draconibacterium sp.]